MKYEKKNVSKNRAPDRRPIKTKNAIKAALLEMLTKKKFDKITIKELAEAANVSRKTFYLHYSSIFEVINEIEDNMTDRFKLIIEEENLVFDLSKSEAFFERINVFLKDNYDFIKKLVASQYRSTIQQDLSKIIKNAIIKSFYGKFEIENKELNIVANFISSGCVGALIEYVLNDDQVNSRKFNTTIKNMIIYGYSQYSDILKSIGEENERS